MSARRRRRETLATRATATSAAFSPPARPAKRSAVRDLAVSFGGVRAVRDLSFDAQPGAITSIIGPNGAGKSTALNAICGFYRPDAGTVRLGDRTISELRALPNSARRYRANLSDQPAVRDDVGASTTS